MIVYRGCRVNIKELDALQVFVLLPTGIFRRIRRTRKNVSDPHEPIPSTATARTRTMYINSRFTSVLSLRYFVDGLLGPFIFCNSTRHKFGPISLSLPRSTIYNNNITPRVPGILNTPLVSAGQIVKVTDRSEIISNHQIMVVECVCAASITTGRAPLMRHCVF